MRAKGSWTRKYTKWKKTKDWKCSKIFFFCTIHCSFFSLIYSKHSMCDLWVSTFSRVSYWWWIINRITSNIMFLSNFVFLVQVVPLKLKAKIVFGIKCVWITNVWISIVKFKKLGTQTLKCSIWKMGKLQLVREVSFIVEKASFIPCQIKGTRILSLSDVFDLQLDKFKVNGLFFGNQIILFRSKSVFQDVSWMKIVPKILSVTRISNVSFYNVHWRSKTWITGKWWQKNGLLDHMGPSNAKRDFSERFEPDYFSIPIPFRLLILEIGVTLSCPVCCLSFQLVLISVICRKKEYCLKQGSATLGPKVGRWWAQEQ